MTDELPTPPVPLEPPPVPPPVPFETENHSPGEPEPGSLTDITKSHLHAYQETNWYAYEGEDGQVVCSGKFFYAWGIPTSQDQILRQARPLGVYLTLEKAREVLKKDYDANVENRVPPASSTPASGS